MPKLVNCIFHKDTNASLALYEQTDSYFCFGCKVSGKLSAVDHKIDYSTVHRIPDVDISRYFELTDEGRDFLTSRNIEHKVAVRYGVKSDSNTLIYPVYGADNMVHGNQVRFISGMQKYKTLPVDGKYPSYGKVFINGEKDIYLVESIFDALSIYSQYEKGSYVLLGTNLKQVVINLLTMGKYNVKIWYDPDATDIAYRHRDQLMLNGLYNIEIIEGGKPYE